MEYIVPIFWFCAAVTIIVTEMIRYNKRKRNIIKCTQNVYKRTFNEKIADDLILFDMVDD